MTMGIDALMRTAPVIPVIVIEDLAHAVPLAEALVTGGLRVLEVRVDRSPRELVEEWNGSPLGVLWQGRGTITHRLGTTTPIEGVFMAGAHTTPGAGLPSVGLSAALVAQVMGPA